MAFLHLPYITFTHISRYSVYKVVFFPLLMGIIICFDRIEKFYVLE